MNNEEALQILSERDRIRVNIINANDAETTKYNNDSVEALNMAIAALKAEPCEDEDAVSREAALKAIEGKEYKFQVYEAIEKLPPVTPKQRTGKWIKSRDRYGNYHFTCPFCEYDIATKYAGAWGDNYCSDCGAKMEGESE